MAKASEFTPLPLTPLSGPLDTRSRPADLAPGAFRYKLNMAITRTGQLAQRDGHSALNFGLRSDDEEAPTNWDFHRQGAQRELVTALFEALGTDGQRFLYAGASTFMAFLDNNTSQWTKIVTGQSSSRYKIAQLEDTVAFTNNINPPRYSVVGSGTSAVIPELATEFAGQTLPNKARVVVEFSGVLMWMQGNFIIWSDYRKPLSYNPATVDTVAGFQYLDNGDTILAAIQLFNSLYIFTQQSIWRVYTNGVGAEIVFGFQRVYSEPRNQTGCLAYPNTLCTNGKELFWWSRDSIWMYSPLMVAPESPDWLLKACGAQFSNDNADRLEIRCCESPVGDYRPDTQEIWFSYPLANGLDTPQCANNRSLVVNPTFYTADLVDHGYGAFVNFNRTPESAQECNAVKTFVASSGADYSLKSIGFVFYREQVAIVDDDLLNDVPDDDYSITIEGYYRRLVTRCPFGYPDKDKTLNALTIQADTKPDDNEEPNLLTLRIGNSYHVADPMAVTGNCTVQWHEQESRPLVCPDPVAMQALEDDQMRPDDDLGWDKESIYEQGRFLYIDVRVVSASGGAPMGSDSVWSSINFSVMTE